MSDIYPWAVVLAAPLTVATGTVGVYAVVRALGGRESFRVKFGPWSVEVPPAKPEPKRGAKP